MGIILAHLPQYPVKSCLKVQSCLNSDQAQLESLETELHYLINALRIAKTLQHLLMVSDLKTQPLSVLSCQKMLIKLHQCTTSQLPTS